MGGAVVTEGLYVNDEMRRDVRVEIGLDRMS